MKNKNDKRGKAPVNFYDRIAEMLGKAAIPQTITVEADGVSPETFSAAGITKRELYAALLDARKSAERELANCSGRSRLNPDNEDDEDGFIKDSTLARYIRNIIKQIDDQRRATAFKQLKLF